MGRDRIFCLGEAIGVFEINDRENVINVKNYIKRWKKKIVERLCKTLTVYTIVDLRLEYIEARARLIGLLIAETAAGKLVKILARIDATFHGC